MKKSKIIFLSVILVFSGCSALKTLTGNNKIGDPNDPDFLNNIQTLKSAYRDGDVKALDKLIEIYENSDMHVKLRVAAGKAIANTEHPRALHAISEMVANTTAIDYSLLNESISMLGAFNENPKAADALVKSMHKLDEKTNEIHVTLVKSLNRDTANRDLP